MRCPGQDMQYWKPCREGKSMREHAAEIKRMSEGMRIGLTVGDPAAKQSIEDLCYEGIPTISGDNDRQAGRMRVMEYLALTEDGVAPWPLHDSPAKFAKSKWPRMYGFLKSSGMAQVDEVLQVG